MFLQINLIDADRFIVADPNHFDSDLDPDPACHFDEDPDPACHCDVDPDPACHFDPDPDPTFHFDADPDPYPGSKKC